MSCNNPEGNRSCVTVLSLAELSSAIYILNSLVTSLNNRLLAYHIINEVTETNIDATTSSTIALPINLTRKPTIIFNLSDTKIIILLMGLLILLINFILMLEDIYLFLLMTKYTQEQFQLSMMEQEIRNF
jgi:hypothetical protein